jgi:hypothetical protein
LVPNSKASTAANWFFHLEWSQRQVSQMESIAHEQNTQRISNLLQEKALVIS